MNMKTKLWILVPAAAAWLIAANAPGSENAWLEEQDGKVAPTLEETRLTMNKWIETQQIISKERNEWQQGKEILSGRLELIEKECSGLEQKLALAQASVVETDARRGELT